MRIKNRDRLLLGIEVGGDVPARNVNCMLPYTPFQDKIAITRDLTLLKQSGSLAVFSDKNFIQNRLLLYFAQGGQPGHILE
ncbi:hypothetical protein D3C74_337170 [compost metagenome]